MKLVGGDSGRYEREEFVSEVLLAPSERALVDVLFDGEGELTLEHRTPERTYRLAVITVSEERAAPSLANEFEVLRTAPELVAERQQLDRWLAAPPDKILALVAEMDDLGHRLAVHRGGPGEGPAGERDGVRPPDAPSLHLHGAGRFLVLSRDGVAEPNLVWKDTVLVRTGQVVDILFDVTNPGLWMAHCHIAEHMQIGMMFSFTVARAQGSAR